MGLTLKLGRAFETNLAELIGNALLCKATTPELVRLRGHFKAIDEQLEKDKENKTYDLTDREEKAYSDIKTSLKDLYPKIFENGKKNKKEDITTIYASQLHTRHQYEI